MSTDKEREAFETWIGGPPYEKDIARWPDDPEKHAWPGSYINIETQTAWEAWEESRRRGILMGGAVNMVLDNKGADELRAAMQAPARRMIYVEAKPKGWLFTYRVTKTESFLMDGLQAEGRMRHPEMWSWIPLYTKP